MNKMYINCQNIQMTKHGKLCYLFKVGFVCDNIIQEYYINNYNILHKNNKHRLQLLKNKFKKIIFL